MQMFRVFLAGLVAAVFVIVPFAYSSSIEKREIFGRDGPPQTKSKRPFCNAFTGCGKKRSDDTFPNAVDLETETEMEKLGQQVLNEARMWETLQARLEGLRRDQAEDVSRYPLYLRKRRSASRLTARGNGSGNRNVGDVPSFQRERNTR